MPTPSSVTSEDVELKEKLLSWVESLHSPEEAVQIDMLEKLKKQCQLGAASPTQLPKYLKFLHDKVGELKTIYEKWPKDYEPKKDLSNLISVLSVLDNESLDCFRFRMSGRRDDLSVWGLEYVRHLAEDLRSDFDARLSQSDASPTTDTNTMPLIHDIARFYMANGCEIDAVDLFLDLDHHERLDQFLDEKNAVRMCRYLQQCSNFSIKEDYLEINRFLYGTYLRFGKVVEAFISSVRALDVEFFHDILLKVDDDGVSLGVLPENAPRLQAQMCYILAHFGLYYGFSEESELETKCNCAELIQLIQNKRLLEAHSDLAIDLDILKPIVPDDLCKLSGSRLSSCNPSNQGDRPRLNMAYAFVSGLANAAFKKDILLLGDGSHKWLLSQKETFLMNSVACLGLLYMWDVDEALLAIDKFLNSSNLNVKAGAALALGVAGANVVDPFLAHFAVLSELVYASESICRQNALMAIGLAHAGTDDPDVLDFLKEAAQSRLLDVFARSTAALSLGMVACGTNLPNSLNTVYIELLASLGDKLSLNDPFIRLIPLGLGLLYVCRYEPIAENTKNLTKLPGNFGKWCLIMIKICSNIGTGNTIAIQKLLDYIHDSPKAIEESLLLSQAVQVSETGDRNDAKLDLTTVASVISETTNEEVTEPTTVGVGGSVEIVGLDLPEPLRKDAIPKVEKGLGKFKNSSLGKAAKEEIKKLKEENFSRELLQGLATIGLALISLNDEIGTRMTFRLLNNFLQFASVGVRRAVPVALSLLSVSHPQVHIIELLSKLSHDADDLISYNAIIGLGVVAAGTNNARVASMLKSLNAYFFRNPVHLFAIRLAQGLVHLSKGVMSLSPLRAEGSFLSPVTIASLLTHSVMSLDVKNMYLSEDPHRFFWLVPAMKLRALLTYDQNNKLVPVTVRVGQAVEDPGQAGRPKRITGFQTHRTPILLSPGDHVELATANYIPCTPILENIVLVFEKPEGMVVDQD